MSQRERDSQRQKVYDAEHHYLAQWGRPLKFDNIYEAQHFVNSITRTPLWQALCSKRFVHAKPIEWNNGTRRYARGYMDRIELPTAWALEARIILHELAHVVVQNHNRRLAAHGPEWVLVFRRLFEEALGETERARLDQSLEKYKVRWGDPGGKLLEKLTTVA